VPRTLDELLTLKGVGRKTASVILAEAYNIPAVPVDTHVYRVSHRLGLSEGPNTLSVELDLRGLFAQDKWKSMHHQLLLHGRYVCHAINPLCSSCVISSYCRTNKVIAQTNII
ncbi:MAG: endonuclease III, partial [Christensenellaceae bacterium]|jgi:endonuclease-3|nr:endonuclease III [Christensenellaceae bacterium]